MSETVTTGVRVRVRPSFWPERSKPELGQWAFTYAVEVVNEGGTPVTLTARHWIITDANGHVEEVHGEGVVGKKPRLGPGESFEYTSWAMLKTPFGTMRGSYRMDVEGGAPFDAAIGEFALTQPHALH